MTTGGTPMTSGQVELLSLGGRFEPTNGHPPEVMTGI
jgi:hypothetical protein